MPSSPLLSFLDAAPEARSRAEIALPSTCQIVDVLFVVLNCGGGPALGEEDQFLVERRGAELPAWRQRQQAPQRLQLINSQPGHDVVRVGSHDPGSAFR